MAVRLNRLLVSAVAAALLLAGGLFRLPQALAGEYHFSPVSGRLSSQFGWRADPMHGGSRFHSGIDIAAPHGAPILAPQAGVVMYSGPYKGYGNVVVLHHGQNLYTLYGHASRLLVNAGDTVRFGQTIAQVGSTGRSTGPHLHFEVHYNRQYVNPLAYLAMLQKQFPKEAALGNLSKPAASAPVRRAVARRTGKTVELVQGDEVKTYRF